MGQRVKAKTKLDRHYSGTKSREFWSRINASTGVRCLTKLDDPRLHLYRLGVVLQDLEQAVLLKLEDCERQEVKKCDTET